jgi:CRISPR-associated protein Csx16
LTVLVTRHSGAIEWLRRQGNVAQLVVSHLDTSTISPGDVVIGTLPVNLIAEVCARGARYLHLSLHAPFDLRGQELTVDQLDSAGDRLEEYHAEFVSPKEKEWSCKLAEY